MVAYVLHDIPQLAVHECAWQLNLCVDVDCVLQCSVGKILHSGAPCIACASYTPVHVLSHCKSQLVMYIFDALKVEPTCLK